MSDLSSATDNTGHYHVRPRPVCLSSSCARSAKHRHCSCRSRALASVDLTTRDPRAVTKDSAYRLQRTCAESAAGVLGLVFCPIAVWRRIAQGRREADCRPSDGKIKGARCAAVGRQKSIDRSDTPREVQKSATACGFVQPIEPAMIRAPRARYRAPRWNSYHSCCERRAGDGASPRAHRPFF
jgi:hypothetical protein